SVVANLQKLRESAADYCHVERRSKLSRDEFMQRYVLPGRPVVLTDLADDWPARTRWTPQYLKQRYGDVEIEVQTERNTDTRYEANKLKLRQRLRLRGLADRVEKGGPPNDHYLTPTNGPLKRARMCGRREHTGTLRA